MSEPFIGMIILVPYNFAPRGYAFCNGQILPISQNTALFSLLGTTYGGNGQTTFALPDLRGRVPNGSGQGPGLSDYTLGQVGGTETVTLLNANLPQHTHNYAVPANAASAGARTIQGSVLGNTGSYAATSDGTTLLSTATTGGTGNSQPVNTLQPYLTLNYCIALEGIFPSRN